MRLRHTLIDERGEWQQRIQAQLYHHGVPRRRRLLGGERRAWLERLELPDAARRQIQVALRMIDAVDAQLRPLDEELRALARRQPGCRALQAHYGIGGITSASILAGLGDARRFSSSRYVRRARHHRLRVRPQALPRPPVAPGPARAALGALRGRPGRTPPRLARPRLLRAGRPPPRRQPRLSVARKLLKRAYHTQRELEAEALQPA